MTTGERLTRPFQTGDTEMTASLFYALDRVTLGLVAVMPVAAALFVSPLL